ncbi:TonB-dependent receptor, partial [Acinetobacter guillouiae]
PSYGADSPSHYVLGENIFALLNTGLAYSRDFAIDGLASPLTVSPGALYRGEQYKQNAGDPIAYTRGPYFNPSTAVGTGIPGLSAGITDQDQ